MKMADGGYGMSPELTVVDVIEGSFGGFPEREAVLALGRDEIDELGFLATQSANALTREPAAVSDVGDLVCPGGWLPAFWGEDTFRGDLSAALRYEPRLLVHDPLADFSFDDVTSLPEMRRLHGTGQSITHGVRIWAPHKFRSGMGNDLDAVR
jgi:hypothetical protein